LRGEIERRARESGVEAMIHVAGWQSSSDVRRSMLQSRAVVMPSFVEGIPVALMEAMALRRPVIATYVGGIPELVRSGETGWLVPAGSVAELANAMRQALATPARQLAEMGERGRHVVLERHDLTIECKKLAALFEAVMSS
jgi:glycosyltransferase involved in cell wall biosynthesis